jgi:ABC-type Zn uptake system ZnuABC Zn-binding protein ZnuA
MLKKIYQSCIVALLLALTMIQAQEPVKVVATYSILGDFLENVGGDLVDLTLLVGRDGDAHAYEPTPQDSVAIADAALVFENGLGFETWLDDLFAASGSSAARVVVSDGIAVRTMQGGEEPSETDPHLWLNPQLVMTMIDNIATALATVDPANKATYLENATAYKAELGALDKDLQAEVSSLPVERRKMITSHDSLGYFADRYGFEVIGAVISSVTTESSNANAGELAKLVDTIKATGVPAIFVENITNAALIEQVAGSAGVSVAPALYTDALGQEGTEGETYLGMMRYNMATIVAALSQ